MSQSLKIFIFALKKKKRSNVSEGLKLKTLELDFLGLNISFIMYYLCMILDKLFNISVPHPHL